MLVHSQFTINSAVLDAADTECNGIGRADQRYDIRKLRGFRTTITFRTINNQQFPLFPPPPSAITHSFCPHATCHLRLSCAEQNPDDLLVFLHSSSPLSTMPTPPQPPRADTASFAPYPLLSFVSYNHDILKLRLSRLHVDFLYNYKLYTERTVDDNRRTELTRGHSIHVPPFNLSTYPIRRVWARLLDRGWDGVGEVGKEEVKVEEDEDEERAEVERAREQYTTRVARGQQAGREGRVAQLGLPQHLFRSEQERMEDERDEKEQTEQRLARKRTRREQWRNDIRAAVERALHRQNTDTRQVGTMEDVEDRTEVDGAQPSSTADTSTTGSRQSTQPPAATNSDPASSASQPPLTPARNSSPHNTNRSPSPGAFTPATYTSSASPLTGVTSSAIPSLCEECGSRIDSMWSQCDFCGFDPLLSEGEEEEGGGRRRKKRGRAARMEKLMAQTALQEKKAKSQQEINKLMETMSPWETA